MQRDCLRESKSSTSASMGLGEGFTTLLVSGEGEATMVLPKASVADRRTTFVHVSNFLLKSAGWTQSTIYKKKRLMA